MKILQIALCFALSLCSATVFGQLTSSGGISPAITIFNGNFLSEPTILTANATLNTRSREWYDIGGPISGNFHLTIAGQGNVRLHHRQNRSHSFGALTVQAGTSLRFVGTESFPVPVAPTTFPIVCDGKLQFSEGGTYMLTNSLTGTGALLLRVATLTARSSIDILLTTEIREMIEFSPPAGVNIALRGRTWGSGTIVKTGEGSLSFDNADNTFIGTATVSQGAITSSVFPNLAIPQMDVTVGRAGAVSSLGLRQLIMEEHTSQLDVYGSGLPLVPSRVDVRGITAPNGFTVNIRSATPVGVYDILRSQDPVGTTPPIPSLGFNALPPGNGVCFRWEGNALQLIVATDTSVPVITSTNACVGQALTLQNPSPPWLGASPTWMLSPAPNGTAGDGTIDPRTGIINTVNTTGDVVVVFRDATNCYSPKKTVAIAASVAVSVPPAATRVCINTQMQPIVFSTSSATGISPPNVGGNGYGLPAGVIPVWAGDVLTIGGQPTEAGTFSYRIGVVGNCGTPVNATGTIIVTPSITVGAPSSTPTVCVGTAITPITFPISGATGIGIIQGGPSGLVATWSADNITVTGTPTTAGNFFMVIPLTGGCWRQIFAQGAITVIEPSVAGAPSSTPTLCINTAMTPITHTVTGATQIRTTRNLPSGITARLANNTVTISGTPTEAGNVNYTISLAGACGDFSATGTIIVTPSITVGAPSSTPTVCVGTAITPITFPIAGATGIGVIQGGPSGLVATWSADNISVTGTPTTAGNFFMLIPLTGGCWRQIFAQGAITVIEPNVGGAPSSTPTLCIDTEMTPITHTVIGATQIRTTRNLPPGITASLENNTVTISGTPTEAGTVNYTISLAGVCGDFSVTGTITVQPYNGLLSVRISKGYIATFCVGIPIEPFHVRTSGATGIAPMVGAPLGLVAHWADNVVTIEGTPLIIGNFNLMIPLTGGCGNRLINAGGDIKVVGSTIASPPSSTPTLCVNTAMTPITHTVIGATEIRTTRDLPPGITASLENNTVTISGTPTEAGTVNYTISLVGVCGDFSATGTITVQPVNQSGFIAPTGLPTFCVGMGIAPIRVNTSGATGIGPMEGAPVGLVASWSDNVVTIEGRPNSVGVYDIIIPLTGGCGGQIYAAGTIKIFSTTIPSPPSSTPTLCLNTPLTAITHVKGSATEITATTNLPAGLTAQMETSTVTISGTPTTAGTFNYTLSLAGRCGNPEATGTITVLDAPAKPTVTVTLSDLAATLTSSAAAGNQWHLNGVAIEGATEPTYLLPIKRVGLYTATVTAGGCTSPASEALPIAITANEVLNASISVSPNPAADAINVGFGTIAGEKEIALVNLLGTQVFSAKTNSQRAAINLVGLPAGVYLLTVKTHDATGTKRIVKQ